MWRTGIRVLKQYSTGQLSKRIWKSDNRVHYRWEKKDIGVQSDMEYKDRPYEIEAFAKQLPLVEEWTNYIKEPTQDNILPDILDRNVTKSVAEAVEIAA